AFLRPQIGDIASINPVRLGNGKLTVQLVLKDRLLVIAVRRHLVLFTVFYLNTRFFHQLSGLAATDGIAQDIERLFHPTSTIGIVAGLGNLTNRFQHFLVTRIIQPVAVALQVAVIATACDTQKSAHQSDRVGLLPLGDKRVFHFVSLAKKTVASFKMRFSISNCFTRDLSCRISSWSGVSLPLPLKACPLSSARYSLIQRPSSDTLISRLLAASARV